MPTKHITIKEFTSAEFTKSNEKLRPLESVLSLFKGGSFMECHDKVFQETGIWIDELVPVFERFDAIIATRNLVPK
jgi:hypothetical protein